MQNISSDPSFFLPGQGFGLQNIDTGDYWRQTQRKIKNTLFNSQSLRRKEWKQFFGRDIDISLWKSNFRDIRKEFEASKLSQDKYCQQDVFLRGADALSELMPVQRELSPAKIRIRKDIGLLRRNSKNTTALACLLNLENFTEEYDAFNLVGIKDIDSGVVKLNYFSPSLMPETKGACNIQFKGKILEKRVNNDEYQFGAKLSKMDLRSQWIYSIQTKLFVKEVGGNDQQRAVISLSQSSFQTQNIDLTSVSTFKRSTKNTLGFDVTNRNAFFKSLSQFNYQRSFVFDSANNRKRLHFNFLNRLSTLTVFSLKPLNQADRPQIYDPFPGYMLPNQKKSYHSLCNTSKIELFKELPYLDPFIQVTSSLNFNTDEISRNNFKDLDKFVQANAKMVVSAGATFDLGACKLSVYWNFLDLVPTMQKRKQSPSFQNFQLLFSCW